MSYLWSGNKYNVPSPGLGIGNTCKEIKVYGVWDGVFRMEFQETPYGMSDS